jgi:hypothetical protein
VNEGIGTLDDRHVIFRDGNPGKVSWHGRQRRGTLFPGVIDIDVTVTSAPSSLALASMHVKVP